MSHFELFSPELTSDVPKITMIGQQRVQVEQHKGIVTYQAAKVAIQTSAGLLQIEGENINLNRYTSSEIIVTGVIDKLFFESRDT